MGDEHTEEKADSEEKSSDSEE
ncbi:hypothetical protein [Shrimp hemocyte iridescent virus]|uniref:Uncharacterized protein n=1 Tax=Shrimp hemocyte iridescent virus TaxID=2039780 RepID=A0A291B0R8_9VIRU|nr:hypothetical protein KM509_gp083 [Shrimp hemocyte iridescent virus]ATE87092.1 hypothetical protein [Shrimp hemocyte iridescent virus]